MQKKLYLNKCKICGTTILLDKKLDSCAACGSDSISHSNGRIKNINVGAIVKTIEIIVGAAIVAAILLFIL